MFKIYLYISEPWFIAIFIGLILLILIFITIYSIMKEKKKKFGKKYIIDQKSGKKNK